jgi:broad-specificity NMP kinase
MFLLISGAAAAGKSTVAKNLSSRLNNLVCHDADEMKTEDEYTRCQQLEEWLQLALRHQREGQDFLLTTHSPLGELLACPTTRKLAGISACLLDCSDPIRIQRMRKRGIDPRWPPAQDVLNWASWHRMHAWDPQWEQHVIMGNGPSDHSYDCWIHWKQTDPRWQVNVIDTSALDVESMLDRVAAWVKSEREKASLLTPDTKWWE